LPTNPKNLQSGIDVMTQRGRKSAASLNVVPLGNVTRQRIVPIVPLSKPARKIFDSVVSNNPHLRAPDAEMLTVYAQSVHMSMLLAKKTDKESVASWSKVTGKMVTLATKLRLTVQSQQHPEKVGRMRLNQHASTSYYNRNHDDDDD
jgi:hypothetical protein